jgi:predicted MFS family arabinose efflux permease
MLNQISVSQRQRIKVILAGISAGILTVGIARFAYTPFLPLMLSQTGLSIIDGGWLATFNYLGYFTGIILVSFTNNLKFKFRFYQLSLIVAVVSTIAMGLTTNLIIWSILRFVAGLTSTAGIILASGFVLSWLKHHGFKPQLGLHFTFIGLGIAIPGLAIVVMNHFLDWSMQWIMMGLFGIVFLIPAWRWMPVPTLFTPKSVADYHEPSKRWLWLMLAAYSCAGVGYVISATFIVAVLEAMPLLTGKGDWIWVMLGLAAVPSCFLWDKLAQRLGEIKTLILVYSLQMFAIVIPALSDNLFVNLLGAMVFGGTFSGIVSLMLTFIGHKFPKNPAKAMARLTLSYGLAQMVAPTIAGYLSSTTQSYSIALWFASTTILLGIVFLFLILRDENKQNTPIS